MRRPITIKHEMEKFASHSGLIHIGALLDAINFRFHFNTWLKIGYAYNPVKKAYVLNPLSVEWFLFLHGS